MAHAYTPGLRVTGYTGITKDRRLPLKGEVLVEKGSDFPLRFGVLVDAFGLSTLLDDALHDPLPHGHGHVIDRRILVERKDIDRFNLVLEGIVKLLGHGHAGDGSADLRIDLGVFQRTRTESLSIRANRIEAPFGEFPGVLRDDRCGDKEREHSNKAGISIFHDLDGDKMVWQSKGHRPRCQNSEPAPPSEQTLDRGIP